MSDIVIVAAQRTAVGRFGGTLAKTPAPDLGAHVVKGLLEKAGVAVVPGDAFGSDEHIRLSFACSLETLALGIERMAAVLAD